MAKMRLTDITVRALKPPVKGQVTYWDEMDRGFGVRVSQGGAKTFVLIHSDKRRRVTIGRFPEVSLAEARVRAKKVRAKLTLHAEPFASITFEKALDSFFETHCASNRASTNAETIRILRSRFLPTLKSRNVTEITADDVAHIVDPILKAGTPSAANHAFMEIRKFFQWASRRGYVDVSPCLRLQMPARITERDRVLNDDELCAILKTARTDVTSSYANIVQLLLVTGQRRNEIASLDWQMIDESQRLVTLPSSLTKNKREHSFPYGEMAVEMLSRIPRGANLLFPARGRDSPFNGWSKAKDQFDKTCGVVNWTLHDLRRTYATNLSKLGVQPHITERLLNHATGQVSGVSAIYNRWSYLPEMRAAVIAYEKHLITVLSGVVAA